jgi:glycosyltransferase involved in cell wall biosynthesis
MRITYIHQYFATRESSTGTRSFEFARRLIDRGHSVVVITTPAALPKEFQGIRTTTHKVIDGIPLLIIPVAYSNRMSFDRRQSAFLKFALLATIEACRLQTDAVFATSTPLTVALPGIVASRFRRVPMVFEVRDLWPELPIAMGALRNPIVRAMARLFEKVAYKMSSHIIALSPGMKEGVCRHGIDPQKVTVIPNGCDIDLFNASIDAKTMMSKQLGVGSDAPVVLYAGTFGKINGVAYLVEIAAQMKSRLPEARFILVGDGVEREHVVNRASELGVLDDNLRILPAMAKKDMPGLFGAASVVASLFIDVREMWNNSANKFFDALAAGRPVMINYGGWQADLLQQSGAGIVLSGRDIQQDSERLAAWLKDSIGVQRSSQKARALAQERFDREKLFEQFEDVLKRACASEVAA